MPKPDAITTAALIGTAVVVAEAGDGSQAVERNRHIC